MVGNAFWGFFYAPSMSVWERWSFSVLNPFLTPFCPLCSALFLALFRSDPGLCWDREDNKGLRGVGKE